MSLVPPRELGEMAGFRLDGLGVTHNEEARLAAFGRRLLVFRTMPEEERQAYTNEFNSLYLPSLARTFNRSIRSDQESGLLSSMFFASFGNFCDGRNNPVVCRFIREQPDLALEAYSVVCVLLSQSATDLDILRDNARISAEAVGRCSFFHIVRLLANFVEDLRPQLPAVIPLPARSSVVRHTIREFLRRFSADRTLQDLWSADNFGSFEPIRASLRNLSEQDEAVWADVEMRRGPNAFGRVWWCCQAQVGPGASVSRPCVKLADGQEMMACGRCVAVRYCSRKHQKADWRRHRKFCFQPTW